ncbi:hypothetical protein TSUD_214870 [Trifolium subterraneum]|uniref:Uncharacterized protein n=1 Tax=Trifolium subterraneum TaxID=3900 RepID=A0A2Z6MGW7_TRISU|nr:hypothetical protein TSUD_214870 [Trifolium subterraneum]
MIGQNHQLYRRKQYTRLENRRHGFELGVNKISLLSVAVRLPMIVVEVYVGESKINPPQQSESSPKRSLLIEGVAQNTNGSVYVPEGANDVEVTGSPPEKEILHRELRSVLENQFLQYIG